MRNTEEIYIDFASKISFLEFIQEEFRPANIPVERLQKEISILSSKKSWNIAELSDFVKANPKSFIVFEAIFQLLRFTNAQLIHFVFDVAKLNSDNLEAVYEYMVLNLMHDQEFREIYLDLLQPKLGYEDLVLQLDSLDRKLLIATFKAAVSKYVDKVSKDSRTLENRIAKKEFEDFSIRFANYLLSNLKLNEILSAIDVKEFLKNKRVPLDTKGLHGNYAKLRITRILEKHGYSNVDRLLNQNCLPLAVQSMLLDKQKIFCTERCIEGIIKPKDRKPKKFDFIIFSEGKPKYLFEVNFYSTEGTKIGINQNEYIDLYDLIKSGFPQCKFYWITDGNYWLTTQGKSRFINLLRYFDQILNINTFAETLGSL